MKGVKHKFQEKCFMKQNLAKIQFGAKNSHFAPETERKYVYEIDPRQCTGGMDIVWQIAACKMYLIEKLNFMFWPRLLKMA